MSDPARLFQSLYLEDMPVTRSQANLAQQRGGRNPRGRGRGRGRAHAPPPAVAPVQAPSGLQYDTQLLSPTSASRAAEGLESSFSVDRVQSHAAGSHGYYAFQLSTPVAVRIHDPSSGRARIYECTCEVYRSTQSPCVHIWWLFVGLHAVLQDSQGADPQRSTQLELNSQLGQLYPIIGDRQASLPRELNRSRSDDAMSDVDEPATQETQSTSSRESRIETLCDILSTFDSAVLPSEFRRDSVESPPPEVSSNSILVPGNLAITMYRLAYRDESFYTRLQQVVPRDERAKQYYEKQYTRAREALQHLSQYAQTGPLGQQLPANSREMDVPECAWRIRSIVDQMCEDRDARTAIAPLGAAVSSRLAVILVRLIAHVITFNSDIYENASWNRNQPINEHPRDRSLFAYLIGDPPYDPSFPSFVTNFFVIDRLRGFPTSEWRHLLELLTTIKDGIEEMDGDAMPMSRAFVGRIDDMLRDYTSTADEPSSSSAQMPRRP